MTNDPPPTGLRERKKAKTRTAIQDHAFRLFRAQGYDQTTVEQIAEAAEVSPSTFFRYFPTKEDVVLYDPFDPLIIAAFLAQPPSLGAVAAMRAAMRAVLDRGGNTLVDRQRERTTLILGVPELRRRMLDDFFTAMEPFAQAIGERLGRASDDLTVRVTVGALLGVGLTTWLETGDRPPADYLERFDAALAVLETGLSL